MRGKDKETSPLQEGVSPPKSLFQSIRRKRDRKDTAHKNAYIIYAHKHSILIPLKEDPLKPKPHKAMPPP